ncbi:MAG: flagellar export protein FliJ [Bacillota bacterium]|jgi:flagellar FliJ protein
MGFKFRLATSLRLAVQELDKAQGVLAQEIRKLQQMEEFYRIEQEIFLNALTEKNKACQYEPQVLIGWHIFCTNQKHKLDEILIEIQKQEDVILRIREDLKLCKIKTEKFKKLRAKQWKEYYAEQLRKDQLFIDDIAQRIGQDF